MIGLLFLACGAGADDTGENGFEPEIPTSNCGGPAYDWAPLDAMGEVVYWEPIYEASLTASGIESIQESAGVTLLEEIKYGSKAYRYRYLTQDRGQVVEATGMVGFPDTNGEPLEAQTLLWLHPTVGFSDACAPSGLGIEHTVPLMLGASQGHIVVAPDYLGMAGFGEESGMLHPYVVAEPTAVASLDAYRGMVDLATSGGGPDLGVVPNGEIVIWGISEGGFAALWTDRYQPHYLPEVEILGVAAIIPASDIMALAQHGLTTFGDTTWGILALLTTANSWFGLPAPLADAITDQEPAYLASTLPTLLETECQPNNFEGADELNAVDDLFAPSFRQSVSDGDWEAAGPFGCMIEAATLPGSGIERKGNTPTLFLVGELDSLAYAGTERESARKLCEEGQDLEFIECAGTTHVQTAVDSLFYQWQWIERRLAKAPWLDGGSCEINAPVDCEGLTD
jgi:pimeloyl-ACP methyl ester carboxylesterase